jgi:hypothetical protein
VVAVSLVFVEQDMWLEERLPRFDLTIPIYAHIRGDADNRIIPDYGTFEVGNANRG